MFKQVCVCVCVCLCVRVCIYVFFVDNNWNMVVKVRKNNDFFCAILCVSVIVYMCMCVYVM